MSIFLQRFQSFALAQHASTTTFVKRLALALHAVTPFMLLLITLALPDVTLSIYTILKLFIVVCTILVPATHRLADIMYFASILALPMCSFVSFTQSPIFGYVKAVLAMTPSLWLVAVLLWLFWNAATFMLAITLWNDADDFHGCAGLVSISSVCRHFLTKASKELASRHCCRWLDEDADEDTDLDDNTADLDENT
ncbi:hypothetical protein GGX14DRAFT_556075 [Mycena pura]|uniref:Uncharacterized protein n=1 Tax=Mycena pura TaxID=153505 RepID=A0AAD7E355_9AGAR|nr:hypothetical protein GGX14DRAFT_556075 [Mycena pura]